MSHRRTLLACLLIVAILATIGCGKKNESQSSLPTVARLTTQEQVLIDSYINGLSALAQKSATADSLMVFYREAAVLARPISDGQIMVVESPRSDKAFMVVPYVDVVTQTRTGGEAFVAAQYGGRIMALYNNGFSDLVRGLLLGHEIVHAQDEIISGEKESEPFSPTWLNGEAHAQYVMHNVLSEYTGDMWRNVVHESARERRSWAVSNGYSEAAMTFSPVGADSTRVVDVFGQLSDDDLTVLLTQLTFSANMFNFYEITKGDMVKYESYAGQFLYEFYAQLGNR
ncbi:MAG: hypothetical protein WCW66_06700 [Patescibacteria group bacterium]